MVYAAPQEYDAPTELSFTLLSYAASFWATLHPTWATLRLKSYATPSELRCNHLNSALPFWATMHPSEQAAPYRATTHPKWATWHPENIMSHAHRSFADPYGKIYPSYFLFRGRFGTKFPEFPSIFVPRNGIPTCFLFRGRVRNGILRVSVPRNSRNSVGINH